MKLSKLKMIRLTAGLTGEEMARFIGLNPAQYSRIENQWCSRVGPLINDRFVEKLGEGFEFLMEPIEVSDLEPIIRKVEKSVAA